jgi:hypothetical protein
MDGRSVIRHKLAARSPGRAPVNVHETMVYEKEQIPPKASFPAGDFAC